MCKESYILLFSRKKNNSSSSYMLNGCYSTGSIPDYTVNVYNAKSSDNCFY